MIPEKIIVSGASGWIGGLVFDAARKRGYQPIGLDRRGGRFLAADISHDSVLSLGNNPLLADAGLLIHCAGLAHRPRETSEERANLFSVNCDGSERILQVVRTAGIRRVVYVGSIASYDWSAGDDIPEEGAVRNNSAYSESKLQGEILFRNSGLDWRVARLATVFGAGDRANFSKLSTSLSKQQFILPGNGMARKSVISARLAAELLLEFGLMESPPHRLINIALPETPTLADICSAFKKHCGWPYPPSAPLSALRLGAYVGDWVAKALPDFPLTSDKLSKVTTNTTVRVQAMRENFPLRQWPSFDEEFQKDASYYQSKLH